MEGLGPGATQAQFVDGPGVVGDAELDADVAGALPERVARNVSAMETYVSDLNVAMLRARGPGAGGSHRRSLSSGPEGQGFEVHHQSHSRS